VQCSSPLWLAETARKTGPIGKSVRIGLTQGADRLLRFYERGNEHISGPRDCSENDALKSSTTFRSHAKPGSHLVR
jgi:3-methyladenine DNA glycosylase Mpg